MGKHHKKGKKDSKKKKEKKRANSSESDEYEEVSAVVSCNNAYQHEVVEEPKPPSPQVQAKKAIGPSLALSEIVTAKDTNDETEDDFGPDIPAPDDKQAEYNSEDERELLLTEEEKRLRAEWETDQSNQKGKRQEWMLSLPDRVSRDFVGARAFKRQGIDLEKENDWDNDDEKKKKREIAEQKRKLEFFDESKKRQKIDEIRSKLPSLMELHNKAMAENKDYQEYAIQRSGESATPWDEYSTVKKKSSGNEYFDYERDVLGKRANPEMAQKILKKESTLQKFVPGSNY